MDHNLCNVKGCLNYGRYCRLHLSGTVKPPAKINPLSKKRQKIQQTEYGPAAADFKRKHPNCSIKSPVCTGKTQGVHHIAGRIGDKLTDKRYWKPACNRCNVFIEDNPAWAIANGFKQSKFKKEAQ